MSISVMRTKGVSKQEEGLVSIIITMIILIVLSLIVLGFAQLARREQRETLDRELATQAQYAAESGINNAKNYIKAQFLAHPDADVNHDDCTALPSPYDTKALDTASNAEFSCVLIDATPNALVYDAITTEHSKIIKIDAKQADHTTAANLDTLDFYWEKQDDSPLPATYPTGFPKTADWVDASGVSAPAVLRVDVVPYGGGFDRKTMAEGSFTFFGHPNGSGGSGSVNFTSGLASQAVTADAKCEDVHTILHPATCKVSVTMPGTSGKYYLRVKSIYNTSRMTIRGSYAGGGGVQTAARFAGEHADIDATGKANDVLRRVRSGYAISPTTTPDAEAAIESAGAVCKLLSVYPPGPAGVGFLDQCPATTNEAPVPKN